MFYLKTKCMILRLTVNILEYIKAHNLNAQRLPSGMYYVTENPGTGAQPVPKKQVTVNYRGTLLDGTEFDSSLKPGRQPFQFVLSATNKPVRLISCTLL